MSERRPATAALRPLLYVVPVLCGLAVVDGALSGDRYAGWERNSVRNSERRWDPRPRVRATVLGSSTSKDWLPAPFLARELGVRPRDVLDAHINGCHQGCTYAQVRRMIQRGRRLGRVFIGSNLFQSCEFEHSKRVLQQQMMLPTADLPRLFAIYGHARRPLRYMARFLGMRASGAYGDTAAVRALGSAWLLGPEKPKRRPLPYRWARPKPLGTPPLSCAYTDADVALKRAFTEALVEDLGQISEHVYWMLLPDRTLADHSAQSRGRWRRHRALYERLAADHDNLSLIDLVDGGVQSPRRFRDGFHLNAAGMKQQRALFSRRLVELGVKAPAQPQHRAPAR